MQQQNTTQQSRGFTIVELLIVIIVIAILATITLVSFNGIQKRAQTATYSSAADQLEKQLRLATTQDSSLKSFSDYNNLFSCFGTPEDYPAEGPFRSGDCYIEYDANGVETARYSINTAFTNQLAAVQPGLRVGKLPTTNLSVNGITMLVRGFFGFVNPPQSEGGGGIMVVWLPPDRSSCSRATSIVSAFQKNLQDAIDVRDGRKTINEVYGQNSGMTMQTVLDSITLYQSIIDSIPGDECMLSVTY